MRTTHVDPAFETEQGRSGRHCHPVLAGAGLGDHPTLAHLARQQGLTEGVVDLVRAGVAEVLALEPDAGAAESRRQPARRIQRSRTADIIRQQILETALEAAVANRLAVGAFELGQRRHQGLWDEPPPEIAEISAGIGQGLHGDSDSTRTWVGLLLPPPYPMSSRALHFSARPSVVALPERMPDTPMRRAFQSSGFALLEGDATCYCRAPRGCPP